MTRFDENDNRWAIPEVGDTVTAAEGLADEAGTILLLTDDDPERLGSWCVRIRWESGIEASGTVYWDGIWLFIPDKR